MGIIEREDEDYLKAEYKKARKDSLTETDEALKMVYVGIGRGLEMALTRIGVPNNELDELCMEAYYEVRAE